MRVYELFRLGPSSDRKKDRHGRLFVTMSYMEYPSNPRIIGARRAVKRPFSVSPIDENAPKRSLRSIAAEVPTACAAVPIDKPPAMGEWIWLIFTILNPVIPPKIPVATTTAAVRDSIPPMAFEISMAMGVVTAFGASEMTTSRVAPNKSARSTTLTIPATHPASSDSRSGRSCRFMDESCL